MVDDPETERAMGRLLKKIGMNPKTRPAVVQAIRTIDPSARFHDIENKETRDYVDQRFAEEEERRAADRSNAQLRRQKAKIAEQYGEENVQKIEQYMIDNGVPNYEVAGKAWGADNAPAMPNNMPNPNQPWQQPAGMKELLSDGKRIRFDRAKAAIDDILKARQQNRFS